VFLSVWSFFLACHVMFILRLEFLRLNVNKSYVISPNCLSVISLSTSSVLSVVKLSVLCLSSYVLSLGRLSFVYMSLVFCLYSMLIFKICPNFVAVFGLFKACKRSCQFIFLCLWSSPGSKASESVVLLFVTSSGPTLLSL